MAIKFSSIRLWLSPTEFTTEFDADIDQQQDQKPTGTFTTGSATIGSECHMQFFNFNSSPLFSYTSRFALGDANPSCVQSAGHAECPTEQTDRYNSESETEY